MTFPFATRRLKASYADTAALVEAINALLDRVCELEAELEKKKDK